VDEGEATHENRTEPTVPLLALCASAVYMTTLLITKHFGFEEQRKRLIVHFLSLGLFKLSGSDKRVGTC